MDLNSSMNKPVSHFEDLSNDLIYEIFDYLDFCHLYDIFSNLNVRFKNLLNDPNYPIKIKFSQISKSTFQHYYINIIVPYIGRIRSLHLLNPCLLGHIFSPISTNLRYTSNFSSLFENIIMFSPVSTLLKFIRLESLVINTINGYYLIELIDHLYLLPNLYSLAIMSAEVCSESRSDFYQQIFRLPKLKYFKISFELYRGIMTIPFATNEFSPIEYLVIEDRLHYTQINNLLSYVPQLRHFSSPSCTFDSEPEEEFRYGYVLNHLTHVSLDIHLTNFDRFELFIKNLFREIEVLHIKMRIDELTDANANRWKQLILSSMPRLRIFDIMMDYGSYDHTTSVKFINWMNEFNSSFWFERQYFFEYQIYKRDSNYDYPEVFQFYSKNSYRTRKNIFCGVKLNETHSNVFKRKINFIHHVPINNNKRNCMDFDPLMKEVTLYIDADQYKTSFKNKFSGIVPFERLTGLLLCYNDISQIIELLQYMPDIHTLQISYEASQNRQLRSIDRDIFQLAMKINDVKNLIILSNCTSKGAEFLLKLFPRLEYLFIERPSDVYDFRYISRRMLYGNLFLLRVRAVYPEKLKNVRKTFMEEYQVHKSVSYFLKRFNRPMLGLDYCLWC